MFGMFERPVTAEEVKGSQETVPTIGWTGETKDPKINPDGSVGTSAELAPLVASYEADRKAAAALERESAIGEPVTSSATGSEHIHLGAVADEVSDEAATEQAEQQMKMSMQAFFEASKAEAEAEEKGDNQATRL